MVRKSHHCFSLDKSTSMTFAMQIKVKDEIAVKVKSLEHEHKSTHFQMKRSGINNGYMHNDADLVIEVILKYRETASCLSACRQWLSICTV